MTHNRKWNTITQLMPTLVLFIGLVSFGISSCTAQQHLEATRADLASTQETLMLEVEKNTELNKHLEIASDVISSREGKIYFVDCEVTEYEVGMIAKTVYGEARGCSKLEQSAVIWCILNRVDKGRSSIAKVITAPNQFHGYNSSFPVTDEIKTLVKDVIARWKLEKIVGGNVGRTLPSNYLYFSASVTGTGNVFRTSWNGGDVWNWDCWNPYS